MKKIIAKLLIKVGNILFKFSHWLENFGYDIPAKVARWILDIGRKLSPKLFCPHCGVPIEKCYYGITDKGIVNTPPYKYHCCNCEYPFE